MPLILTLNPVKPGNFPNPIYMQVTLINPLFTSMLPKRHANRYFLWLKSMLNTILHHFHKVLYQNALHTHFTRILFLTCRRKNTNSLLGVIIFPPQCDMPKIPILLPPIRGLKKVSRERGLNFFSLQGHPQTKFSPMPCPLSAVLMYGYINRLVSLLVITKLIGKL